MTIDIKSSDPNFPKVFSQLLAQRQNIPQAIEASVKSIIAKVQEQGDQAIVDLTSQYDGVSFASLKDAYIGIDEIDSLTAGLSDDLRRSMTLAATRIRDFHQKQLPQDNIYQDASGTTLGWRWRALASAGLYVPGGQASYPSTVLMNAIPAKIAGVQRIVMVSPPQQDGRLSPAVLLAAKIAGVSDIFCIGGVQAIAALAYGTQTITAVDKIVGPGNIYVTAAKKQVFGMVGIDSLAGPSEIVILAGANNNPDWVAIDLLAQAEHDKDARSILLSCDDQFADKVRLAIARLLPTLSRRDIAEASWNKNGAIIRLNNINEAPALIDNLAPEHLVLATADYDIMLERINNAGAIFLGAMTPEAIGDYVAGSNHVLPTGRSARFTSGLSVMDFVKRSSVIGCGRASLQAIGPAAINIAEAEGLTAHALSIKLRLI